VCSIDTKKKKKEVRENRLINNDRLAPFDYRKKRKKIKCLAFFFLEIIII